MATPPPRHEANLEISSLLNISSGMRFKEEKRKFAEGVDCSTQKENQQTLYNNNRMCANNDFVTQHACPLARNIDLPFIR